MKCKHHGPAAQGVWACPTCLVELREENQRLRAALDVSQEALQHAQADRECPSTTRQALAAIKKARICSACNTPLDPLCMFANCDRHRK